MKKRYKAYLKVNIVSLFFIVVSFISVTLAWFAYSGLSTVETEIGVKAWYVELEKDNKPVSNNIVITKSEIYPGMETVHELVNIKNSGDSDANLSYEIESARILDGVNDNYVVGNGTSSDSVEDKLSHKYPFHINISLSKKYALAKGDTSTFEVSISWPLDSGSDTADSEWGASSYQFQTEENEKKEDDNTYQVQPAIKVVINVKAEQYIGDNESSDTRYDLGDEILYDVVNKRRCETENETCIRTIVIDDNNRIGETTVTLLPKIENNTTPVPYEEYTGNTPGGYQNVIATYANYNNLINKIKENWQVETRSLVVEDLLRIISKDVKDSNLIRPQISDTVVGYLQLNSRMASEIDKAITENGYYEFTNNKFPYITPSTCYWVGSTYGEKMFAIKREDINKTRIYGENKTASCKAIPVIIADKSGLAT